jgi:hypothetical protein
MLPLRLPNRKRDKRLQLIALSRVTIASLLAQCQSIASAPPTLSLLMPACNSTSLSYSLSLQLPSSRCTLRQGWIFAIIRAPSHRLAYMRSITSTTIWRFLETADFVGMMWTMNIMPFLCEGSDELQEARWRTISSLFNNRPVSSLYVCHVTSTIPCPQRTDALELVAKFLHAVHNVFISAPV